MDTVIQGVSYEGWTVPPFILVSGKYHLSTLSGGLGEL